MSEDYETLHDTVRQPGAVWCYSQTAQGVPKLDHREPSADLPFRWLHLNLADQRSLRWLDTQADLPAPAGGDAWPRGRAALRCGRGCDGLHHP
jgi:hypothetical protein